MNWSQVLRDPQSGHSQNVAATQAVTMDRNATAPCFHGCTYLSRLARNLRRLVLDSPSLCNCKERKDESHGTGSYSVGN